MFWRSIKYPILNVLCDWHFLNRSMKNGSLVYIIYFILIINLAQNKLEKESILLVTIHEDQLLVILLLILYWIAKRNRLISCFIRFEIKWKRGDSDISFFRILIDSDIHFDVVSESNFEMGGKIYYNFYRRTQMKKRFTAYGVSCNNFYEFVIWVDWKNIRRNVWLS